MWWPIRRLIHWPCYCTVHVYVVINFCDSIWSFWVEASLCRFFFIIYLFVLLLEFQLSREEGWDPIIRFKPATFLFLTQARTCIPNAIWLCSVIFCIQLRREVNAHFVDIGGIDNLYCLNFLFIIMHLTNLLVLFVL